VLGKKYVPLTEKVLTRIPFIFIYNYTDEQKIQFPRYKHFSTAKKNAIGA
jgi:hypothetical protein